MKKNILVIFVMLIAFSFHKAYCQVPDVGSSECVYGCDSPSSSSGGSDGDNGDWTSSYQESEGAGRARLATKKNNEECLRYQRSSDYDRAISCFESALNLNPSNAIIQKNLKHAKQLKANKLGFEYYYKYDWLNAIKYFKEALSYGHDDTIRTYLMFAEAAFDTEKQKRSDLADAKENVNEMLDNLSADFDGSQKDTKKPPAGFVEFKDASQFLFSKGDKNSAYVATSQPPDKKIALAGAGLGSTQPVGSDVVDLRGVHLNKADQNLMKNQWEMSIDWRHKNDPVVQQYIRDLWASSSSGDEAKAVENEVKIKRIVYDQMMVEGRSPQEVDEFFGKIKTFLTGEEAVPIKWDKSSKLAKELDAQDTLPEEEKTDEQLAKEIAKAKSIKADVSYMGTGTQTGNDCVLYAIANGAQVPVEEVRQKFAKTFKNLGVEPIELRRNPNPVITDKAAGGRGGLTVIEELLVAEQVGDTIAVPRNAFARAIEKTGKPVVATVILEKNEEHPNESLKHEVVITGVYRTKDGAIYYSVMDSNLADQKNFTVYTEKSWFESKMDCKGGYVVVPTKKK